jgi:hypothetical protein
MPSSRAIKDYPQPVRTFDEVFADHHLTVDEYTALVWHLAALRARKTVEALLPRKVKFGLGFDPKMILR